MKKGLFTLALYCLVWTGCNLNSTAIPENFDLGSTENNLYTNSFFKMEMPVPENWSLQTKEELQVLMNLGKATLKDQKYADKLSSADIRNATLFGMFKYPLDSLVEFNPSLLMIAENIRIAPSIKTGQDYLEQSKKTMNLSNLNYTFEDDLRKITLSGKDFYILTAQTNSALVGNITQRYYTSVIDGFALSIIVSYNSDEQLAQFKSIIGGIVFKE